MRKFGKFIITSLLVSSLNFVLLYVLTDIVGLWYMASAVILTITLVVVSFAVNYYWTWRIKKKELKVIVASRFVKYIVVGGSTALLIWGLLYTLTEFGHLYYLISATITWVVAVVVAFLSNNYWTYGKGK